MALFRSDRGTGESRRFLEKALFLKLLHGI
jgi:hypothetical protein